MTFFRAGVDRRPANPSRWAVRDLYMAHLAVTDVPRGEHHVAERLNRAGVGWAGADPETLHVWNDGWSLTLEEGAHRLVAASDDGRLAVDLRLQPSAPPVLHGDGGYSRKGNEPGNASHYYSLTRLPTMGRLTVGGRSFDVAGASWMDHEFGSSFLEPAQAGWDWFSIQLDDGTDLMLYTMRRRRRVGRPVVQRDGRDAGGGQPASAPATTGSFPAGAGRPPTAAGPILSVGGSSFRRSASSSHAEAAVDAQELRTGRSTGVTYWEGTIDVRGTRDGTPVTGRGYLEMTGYAGPPLSRVLR